jgi:RNA polymerase sigma-70 factor (ECF subfamily)
VGAASTSSTLQERELLEAARSGNEDAFRRVVEAHHAELHAHCYRMLGSLHDAEDALQEALLRAWRGFPRFAGRSSIRSWLYKIATNACLDLIARRPKRVLPVDYGPATSPRLDLGEPLAESVWVEPYPDDKLGLEDGYVAPDARYEQREAVELAFVAAMQHLPARQRAVLIMREVLGFSAREVADALETTVASVNSALQRARKTVDGRLPERSQQATLRSLGDTRIRDVVQAYVEAWARGDVDAIRALLAEDAVVSMPPWAVWWRGRETIAGFAPASAEVCPESRSVSIRASGQPATAYYHLDAETGRYLATAIEVVTLEGALIKEATAFVMPELFPYFGLPRELAP